MSSSAEALDVDVTVTNRGAGHAVPTGEPLRSVLLTVQARCGGTALRPTGGDVVPSFGGALAEQASSGDWSSWPGAVVGQRIRVVRRLGHRDYVGPGPFGDGRLDAAEKGLPLEVWADEAEILAVDGARVTLDHALTAGDVAYRVDDQALAGAPGFGFARVLADAEGRRQVPHHRAVDVVSDNRINGQTFPDIAPDEVPQGSEIVNVSPVHHPFHLHGMTFEVLSVDGVAPPYRTVEDTFDVGVRQVVRLLIQADNPGDWMSHCHILPHASNGMMTVLTVLP